MVEYIDGQEREPTGPSYTACPAIEDGEKSTQHRHCYKQSQQSRHAVFGEEDDGGVWQMLSVLPFHFPIPFFFPLCLTFTSDSLVVNYIGIGPCEMSPLPQKSRYLLFIYQPQLL